MKKDDMKYFIILAIIYFSICLRGAFACQISVPTSEAQRYIDALPNGVPPLFSCFDKPEEVCHCTDEIIWEQAEIASVFEEDELGINIEKKVLRISEAKKTAYLAKIEQDKAKEDAKKAAKASLKTLDIDGATTIAKLKVIVKALIEAQE
jgi:hypothetical protein